MGVGGTVQVLVSKVLDCTALAKSSTGQRSIAIPAVNPAQTNVRLVKMADSQCIPPSVTAALSA